MMIKSIVTFLVISSFTVAVLLTTIYDKYRDPTPEKQIKVFMYPLDDKFNMGNLQPYISYYPQMIQNSGLGLSMFGSEYVMDTNQYSLEIYFYHRLMKSKYLTESFEEADLIYYPIFGHVFKLNAHKGKRMFELDEEFWQLVKNDTRIATTQNIRKHFTIYGGCEQFSERFRNHSIPDFTMVMLERNETNAIVAPYPAQIHFSEYGQYEIDFSKKDIMVSSVWNSRKTWRKVLSELCLQNPSICTHYEIDGTFYDSLSPAQKQELTLKVYTLTTRSVFCLSPSGDTLSRKAFYDALQVGCINVINEKFKMPFDDKIDYDKLTVYVPNDRMNETFEIIQNISPEDIKVKQQYILEHRVHLQYYQIPEDYKNYVQKDAFDYLIDELYEQSLITK